MEIASGVGKADEVWALAESQLASGLSIGFIGTKGTPIATGMRWDEWTLLEISICVIAANPGARVTATRAQSDGSIKLRDMRGAVALIPARGTR